MHRPGTWHIVSQHPLILSAMCTCGDPNCAYTVSPSAAVNAHLEPFGIVPV